MAQSLTFTVQYSVCIPECERRGEGRGGGWRGGRWLSH